MRKQYLDNLRWATVLLMLVIVVGLVTKYIDTANVTTGHEPECCIKTVSIDGSKVTYWGLGYKVVRYVSVSPYEPYDNNIGVKMGSWFMKYENPARGIIDIKILGAGNTLQITDKNDVDFIANLLENSKYIDEPCDGISTYAISYDNYTYDVLADCREIKKGNKQAKISDDDMNTLENIIARCNKNNLTLEQALKTLSEREIKSIKNLDEPKVEEIIFSEKPSIFLLHQNKDITGRVLEKITYNTEQDGLLGPIVFYVEKESGIVVGMDYRE